MQHSKSFSSHLERLDKLTDRQDYMFSFFDELRTMVQKDEHRHLLSSQSYYNMMCKLTLIQDLRSSIAQRGHEICDKPDLELNPEALQEMHFIRMVENGYIASIWDAFKEFLRENDLNIYIDLKKI